LTENQC